MVWGLTFEALLSSFGAAAGIVEVVAAAQDGGAADDLPESGGRHYCWYCVCEGGRLIKVGEGYTTCMGVD